jgi:hypothetical protein
MKIQERIGAGVQARIPQGQHRVGAPGDGSIDRRARKQAWTKEDNERAANGQPPRGVISFRVLPPEASEHGTSAPVPGKEPHRG